MNPTITEIDARLAALNAEIASKKAERSGLALRALVDKSVATARTRLKAELVGLEVDRDDLLAALEQARQLDEDERSGAEAAREHAQREAAAAKRRESNARAWQAADTMEKGIELFLAGARALHAERAIVTPTTNELLTMVPRRVIKGVCDNLRAEGLHFANFEVRDVMDHWDLGIRAIDHFKRSVAP